MALGLGNRCMSGVAKAPSDGGVIDRAANAVLFTVFAAKVKVVRFFFHSLASDRRLAQQQPSFPKLRVIPQFGQDGLKIQFSHMPISADEINALGQLVQNAFNDSFGVSLGQGGKGLFHGGALLG
jgi:hypothetical protein